MGTIVVGYGDAAFAHEGYAAQVLDDGSITGTYNAETEPRMIGQLVAACECGWAGTTRYRAAERFDEQAAQLALGEWERVHVIPILDRDRVKRWDRLRWLLDIAGRRLAVRCGVVGEELGQTELLNRTLRDLTEATALAEGLQERADRAVKDRGRSR